jgi:hypothetical protein
MKACNIVKPYKNQYAGTVQLAPQLDMGWKNSSYTGAIFFSSPLHPNQFRAQPASYQRGNVAMA